MHRLIFRLIIYLIFFLSGAAALIYQVAWHRLLVVFAGGDVLAITLIVTAFMVGLGFGSSVGGSVADRFSRKRSLVLFGMAELAIAAFGLVSKTLYYDVLYLEYGPVAEARGVTAAVLIIGLLIPTALMGMSLPLLSKALIPDLPHAAGMTGRLYGINTLGAALGAFATTWMLMPIFGIEGSLRWAALLNGICAVSMMPLSFLQPLRASEESTQEPLPTLITPEKPWKFRNCLWVFALSGFVALGLEMVWFRLLGVLLKSTAFTFGTLLSIYLFGIGAGAFFGTGIAPRIKKPGQLFLILQWGIALYASAGVTLALATIHHWPLLQSILQYLDSYEPIDANTAIQLLQNPPPSPGAFPEAWIFPWMHGLLPLVLMGPPTFLMGLAFTMLQKVAHQDVSFIGRRIGWLQTANIIGSTLGTLVVGLLLLPLCGTPCTLRLLALIGGSMGLLLIRKKDSLSLRALQFVFGAILLTSILALPDSTSLWAKAHGTTPDRVHVAEDGAGVSLLKKASIDELAGAPTMVFVNGIGQSWIPFGGVHSALGALPSLMHPRPEKIAVIGLGSGDTLYCVMARPETEKAVCIEIVGAELDTLRAMAAEAPYTGLRRLIDDPRVHHVAGDGRQYLMMTDERFDIIEADALRPTSAHSGNLYSEEYFRLVSSRLTTGGYAVTWAPTQRVVSTFEKVFPHVILFPHILVGSNEPIDLETTSIRLRMNQREIQRHFQLAGIDLFGLLEPFLSITTPIQKVDPSFDRATLRDINTDVFPKDEVSLPALWENF